MAANCHGLHQEVIVRLKYPGVFRANYRSAMHPTNWLTLLLLNFTASCRQLNKRLMVEKQQELTTWIALSLQKLKQKSRNIKLYFQINYPQIKKIHQSQ